MSTFKQLLADHNLQLLDGGPTRGKRASEVDVTPMVVADPDERLRQPSCACLRESARSILVSVSSSVSMRWSAIDTLRDWM